MSGPFKSGLREELERIAEQAPRVVVPADTWRRGQRARLRSVALSAGAAVAVLALVAGTAGLLGGLPSREAVPADGSDPGAREAVPSHLWSVPERMAAQGDDGEWLRDEVESDLAIGRGAAAYVMRGGLPVVVDAEKGDYHLLDLPGFLLNRVLNRAALGDTTSVALSPDGRQLAYAWAGPAPRSDATPMPSGIRVVTLETGDVRTVPIRGGRGTMVTDIGWSPDSAWIVWVGRRLVYWTDSATGARDPAAGRIGRGATSSQQVPVRTEGATLAIADDGSVTVLEKNQVSTWDGKAMSRVRLRVNARPPLGAFAPGGAQLSLGTSAPTDDARVLDVATRRLSARPLASRESLYPQGAEVRPLGWIDDDLMVTLVTPVSDSEPTERQIVVMTRERRPDSTYRIVGRTAPAVDGNSLTVAVDLMTLDRPTVGRPEPEWPWSAERWAMTGGLAALVVLALVGAARGWRRSRRPAQL
ncbi:hypothetical protein [Nocardioides pacificus]